MRMEPRLLLLTVVATGVVLALGVMTYLEFDSDSMSGKTLVGRASDSSVPRGPDGLGNDSEARGSGAAVRSRRSKAASRTASDRIARPRTGSDDESKRVESGRFEKGYDSVPGADGSGASPSEGKRRSHDDLIAERAKIREQKRSQSAQQGERRPKGPGRRTMEQFQAYWEGKNAVEQQMEPEAYEQMLYENGEPNVVSVKWVALGSTAAQAGLQPGDVIVSYGGNRVYQPGAIRWSNSKTAPGQPIEVQFYREGKLYSAVMTRDGTINALRGNINGMRVAGERSGP